MSWKIRDATLADVPALSRIVLDYNFDAWYLDLIECNVGINNVTALVAEDAQQNTPVGFVAMIRDPVNPSGSRWWETQRNYISLLMVAPPHQGKGVALRLLLELPQPLTLEVDKSNHRAVEVYKKFGFYELVEVGGSIRMSTQP